MLPAWPFSSSTRRKPWAAMAWHDLHEQRLERGGRQGDGAREAHPVTRHAPPDRRCHDDGGRGPLRRPAAPRLARCSCRCPAAGASPCCSMAPVGTTTVASTRRDARYRPGAASASGPVRRHRRPVDWPSASRTGDRVDRGRGRRRLFHRQREAQRLDAVVERDHGCPARPDAVEEVLELVDERPGRPSVDLGPEADVDREVSRTRSVGDIGLETRRALLDAQPAAAPDDRDARRRRADWRPPGRASRARPWRGCRLRTSGSRSRGRRCRSRPRAARRRGGRPGSTARAPAGEPAHDVEVVDAVVQRDRRPAAEHVLVADVARPVASRC